MNRNAGTAAIAPARRARTAIAPDIIEISLLWFAVGCDLALLSGEAYGVINIASPIALGLIMVIGLRRLMRRNPAGLWTPLFALRVATIVYLSIGSLVPYFSDDQARAALTSLYPYTALEQARFNILCMLGTAVVLSSIRFGAALLGRPRSRPHPSLAPPQTFRLGFIYLFFGIGFFYLFYVPTQLTSTLEDFLPGILIVLMRALIGVGTFLITLWAIARGGMAYLLVFAVVATNIFGGVILLEKQSILLPLLMSGLAFLLQKASLTRILVLTLCLGGVLALSTPAVQSARIMHGEMHSNLQGGDIVERLGYWGAYLRGEGRESSEGDITFVRLSYIETSSYVMYRYDSRRPAETISNSLVALVPRAIWPDKPVISGSGTDLYEMLTGRDTSSSGIVVYADAYWNFGWSGLLLFLPAGIFLWWASMKSLEIVEARDWFLMPFVLTSFVIGMSVDNFFLATWFTPAVTGVLMLIALRAISPLVLPFLGGSRPAGWRRRPVAHKPPQRLVDPGAEQG